MRLTLRTALTAAALAVAALLAASCGSTPEPAKPAPGKPAKPSTGDVPAQPQATPPQAEPSKPSVTAANGLEMTVRTAKAEFLVGEPLEVLATFRNTSERPFKLLDVDVWIPDGVRIVDANTGTAWDRHCALLRDRDGVVSAVLGPGKSYAARGTMSWEGGAMFGAYDFLPPGNYNMTLGMTLEDPSKHKCFYSERQDARFGNVNEFWSGEVKSEPVRFAVKSNRLGRADETDQRMVANLPKRLAAIGAGAELAAQGDDFEAYRVFSYGEREERYQLVTIEKRGERCTLEVRQPDDRGVARRFEVTPQEWAEFRKKLDCACFWHVPAGDGQRGEDGSHVWIEGRAGGEHHAVYRWCGGPAAMQACVRHLQDLAAKKQQETKSAPAASEARARQIILAALQEAFRAEGGGELGEMHRKALGGEGLSVRREQWRGADPGLAGKDVWIGLLSSPVSAENLGMVIVDAHDGQVLRLMMPTKADEKRALGHAQEWFKRNRRTWVPPAKITWQGYDTYRLTWAASEAEMAILGPFAMEVSASRGEPWVLPRR